MTSAAAGTTLPAAESPGTPVLRITGLRVDYRTTAGTRTAVDGLDLEAAPGRITAVVGESGSGKSTTAHAVIGLLPPGGRVERGSVRLEGEELTGLGERAWRDVRGLRIGFVPQDPGVSLDPVKPVGRQVAEVLRVHHLATGRGAAERAVDLLAAAGLPDPARRARQYPHELSGGMRQRVLIAMATAAGPRLLVADEPTSALDVTVQRQILDHLERLAVDTGTAVLLITHDLGVVADRAQHVVVMSRARVVESGPTGEVLADPQHPYTRRLLADVPRLAPRVRRPAHATAAAGAATGAARVARSGSEDGKSSESGAARTVGAVRAWRRPGGGEGASSGAAAVTTSGQAPGRAAPAVAEPAASASPEPAPAATAPPAPPGTEPAPSGTDPAASAPSSDATTAEAASPGPPGGSAPTTPTEGEGAAGPAGEGVLGAAHPVSRHPRATSGAPRATGESRPTAPPRTRVLTDPASGAPDAAPGGEAPDGPAPGVLLRVRGLTLSFPLRGPGPRRRHLAVDDVSFDVPRGHTLGLVGESGSGKSTTARLVLGLERPEAGTVELDGADVTALRGAARRRLHRRVQLVHQNPYASLNPRFTVEELLTEPLRNHRVGDRAQRAAVVRRLLDDVALPSDTLARKAAELSGGQRQRVAIARALALGPELLVCDEPVSALDVTVQARILELLLGLQERHRIAYLFISHDLAVVGQVSDRIAVLRDGHLVEENTADRVLRAPQHPYTRELLAAVPGRNAPDGPAGPGSPAGPRTPNHRDRPTEDTSWS
ncbi:dipeptide ABC transporter ATP-binding protein [Streptomyces sp. NPDC008150]|uniref:dipeptide ABC transporter ATP-binding protein n=1 Tax=Streptomyces sp. NPDC008150 TaxID=3364816 RepID=UPI0036EB80FA